MLSDLEIAQATPLKRIGDIAAGCGIQDDELEPYGRYKAKIRLDALERLRDNPNGKYIDVTAITPTPLGEGKTVTTIGLSLGLNKLGKRSFACLRQPSMGPTFGIKGGAAGGGHAQVVPMEEFNLHLTGDIHAVEIAHNLLAAMIDNHLHQGNALGINPHAVTWRRVVDVSDRALRNIVVGLGGKPHGVPRESGFDITVASELMALLALTEGLRDLRKRIGNVVIAQDRSSAPLTADDLQAAGAMTVLLREALMPTLMQTTENTPVLVHTGPFANIAHGNSSILADRLALKLSDYVVTESGFGADMGAEKFVNIKCRYSGLRPDAMVVVATIRALKMHSGDFSIRPGKPLDPKLREENLDAIRRGVANLAKQIENVAAFGVPCVVAINRFPTDTPAEIDLVREAALDAGARSVAVSDVHARGGDSNLPRRSSSRPNPPRTRSASCIRWTPASGRRSTRSPRPCTAPRASTTSRPPRKTSPGSRNMASPGSPSAWPKPSCRCRTIRPSRAVRRDSTCSCGRCGSRPGPGLSFRIAATSS